MADILQGFPQINAPIAQMNSGVVTQPWYNFFIALWGRTGTAQGGNTSPTGMIMAYPAASPPTGWAICDGSAVSRIVYAALFSVIGTTWGSGDGGTTFNIPNLSNRFLVGSGILSVGSRGGGSPLTLTTDQLPAHTHTALVAASNVTAGAAAGGVTAGNTGSTGLGDPITLPLPPYAAVIWCIKT